LLIRYAGQLHHPVVQVVAIVEVFFFTFLMVVDVIAEIKQKKKKANAPQEEA
jgi:hypothetical protein